MAANATGRRARRAIEATAVIAGTAAAVWLARSGRAAAAGHLVRLGPREYLSRRILGVPAGYPERVDGGDDAAREGDFPAWTAEMAAAGLEAAEVINAVRREEEW